MSSPGARFAWFLVGLAFFFPLAMIGGRRGIFIPSARWEAWAFVAYVVTLAFVIGLAVLAHWNLVERGQPKGVPATPRRIMLRVVTACLLLVLPVWVLGLVHGLFRAVLDRPVLERLEIVATFDSYHEDVGRRSTSRWVVLNSAEYGRLRITVGEAAKDILPQAGSEIVVIGRRTWIGDRYDTLRLLEH